MAVLTMLTRLPAAVSDTARDAVTNTRSVAAHTRELSTTELLTHARSLAWRLLRSRKARMITYTLVACAFAVATNVTTTFTATEYASRGFLIMLVIIVLDWLMGVAIRGITAAARKLIGSPTISLRTLTGRANPVDRRNITTRRPARLSSDSTTGRVNVTVRGG